MIQTNAVGMNPVTSAIRYGHPDPIQTHLTIVISGHRHHDRCVAECSHKAAQLAQFRPMINQVATQKHGVGLALINGRNDLPAQQLRTTTSQVNIADVQQSTRVMPCREPLVTHRQSPVQPDFQQLGRQCMTPGDGRKRDTWAGKDIMEVYQTPDKDVTTGTARALADFQEPLTEAA